MLLSHSPVHTFSTHLLFSLHFVRALANWNWFGSELNSGYMLLVMVVTVIGRTLIWQREAQGVKESDRKRVRGREREEECCVRQDANASPAMDFSLRHCFSAVWLFLFHIFIYSMSCPVTHFSLSLSHSEFLFSLAYIWNLRAFRLLMFICLLLFPLFLPLLSALFLLCCCMQMPFFSLSRTRSCLFLLLFSAGAVISVRFFLLSLHSFRILPHFSVTHSNEEKSVRISFSLLFLCRLISFALFKISVSIHNRWNLRTIIKTRDE